MLVLPLQQQGFQGGVVNLHQGSFGIWVNCACGHGFADYRLDDADELTPWEQHEAEHGISTATATKRKDG